ncbi:MAG: beta-ketoacyl-ACP synthase II [Candidatus Nealsonbacteria bacterium]
MRRRVVITGMGAVTPLGNDVPNTWKRLISGKSGISELTRFNLDDYGKQENVQKIAGEVRKFNLENWGVSHHIEIEKIQLNVKRMDLFVQYALAAAIEAVDDAQLDLKKENLKKIGVEIGCAFAGATTWEEQHIRLLKKGSRRVSAFFIPMVLANMVSGNLSIYFGTKGPNLVMCTACAAASHAIGEAFLKIRYGMVNIMITGGTQAVLRPLAFSGFNNMRALSHNNDNPEKASRPFDLNRDGLVMAEGAGILVLEELKHAEKRKAKIYGELIGFGMNSDACSIVNPCVEGPAECMRIALRDARIRLMDIDYINAHGTSTQIGDINEAKSIREVFQTFADYFYVGSTKSATGHMFGAGGAVEAIFCILALRNGIIPPMINLENPDPECDLKFAPKKAVKIDIVHALSNSFGFGGTNACLAFKKY